MGIIKSLSKKEKVNHVLVTARNKLRKLEKLLKLVSESGKKQVEDRINYWKSKLGPLA